MALPLALISLALNVAIIGVLAFTIRDLRRTASLLTRAIALIETLIALLRRSSTGDPRPRGPRKVQSRPPV